MEGFVVACCEEGGLVDVKSLFSCIARFRYFLLVPDEPDQRDWCSHFDDAAGYNRRLDRLSSTSKL
jgi:hypothetical protein